MSTRTSPYLDAIDHLPEGASLVIQQVTWDEYESLLQDLDDRPHLRLTYDQGRLEIMSPLPEHEEYASFIDDLVRVYARYLRLKLEKRGRATWKRSRLARGVEPDACYYVANAHQIIGKRKIDLEVDPPPDIAVEIDIKNESLSKFPIYGALGVPEIWHYDGKILKFYELVASNYVEISQSKQLPGLTPASLAGAIEHSKSEGQDAALDAFRNPLRRLE